MFGRHHGDNQSLSADFNHVAGHQFFSASCFHFPIKPHLTLLDQNLCLTAGSDNTGLFEKLIERDLCAILCGHVEFSKKRSGFRVSMQWDIVKDDIVQIKWQIRTALTA